eukprot:EG_transcript_5465
MLAQAPDGPSRRPPLSTYDLKYLDFIQALTLNIGRGLTPWDEDEVAWAALEREWATGDQGHHWQYAVQPVPHDPADRMFDGDVRDNGHEGWTLDTFLACPEAQRAGLNRAEIAALRLYTGPGFRSLNAINRRLDPDHEFAATTAILDRAISKLARTSPPPPPKLYRGLQGALRKDFVAFYERFSIGGPMDMVQFSGPVGGLAIAAELGQLLAVADSGFLSTTADVAVATGSTFGGNLLFILHHPPANSVMRNFLSSYRAVHAPDATPIPFSFQPAPVGWLSQYPQEAELLWPSATILFPLPKNARCGDNYRGILEVEAVAMYPVHPQTQLKAFDASVMPAIKLHPGIWDPHYDFTVLMVRHNVSTNAWNALTKGWYADRALSAQVHQSLQTWADAAPAGTCRREAVTDLISSVAAIARARLGPCAAVDEFEATGLALFAGVPEHVSLDVFLSTLLYQWHPAPLPNPPPPAALEEGDADQEEVEEDMHGEDEGAGEADEEEVQDEAIHDEDLPLHEDSWQQYGEVSDERHGDPSDVEEEAEEEEHEEVEEEDEDGHVEDGSGDEALSP